MKGQFDMRIRWCSRIVGAGFLFVMLALASCTEKIDIALDNSYIRLVVEGCVTTDTMRHTVRLTTTSSYYYNQPAPVVEHARVLLNDGFGSVEMKETSPGIYRTDASYFGIPGRTYTLNIELAEDIGGHLEYSATSMLHGAAEMDSIGLLLHPDWGREGIWEVKCYVLEPPTVDFYRFLIYRNSRMLTDSLPEWFTIDDLLFNGNYTNGATVAYLNQDNPGESLVAGDTITLEVNNIGKEYANFILEAQSEVRGSNPLFSGPPANVKGNISNGAVGFFAAYGLSRRFAIVGGRE